MNLSAVFIERPVLTAILTSAFILFGGYAFFGLPVNELPNVEFPTISVTVGLTGASPETMASAVATPLERAFSAIAGIDSMASVSSSGNTRLTMQFKLDRSIDAAAQDVQAALSQAIKKLPTNIDPPVISKANPSDAPILHLALTSKTVAMPVLNQFASDRVALRLASVPGIGQIDINGAQKYAVRIYLNPQAMAARKLGFDQVVADIQAANSNAPSGTLSGTARSYTVTADAQLTTAAAFGQLVLAYQGGQPVHLNDIGRVADSVENNKTSASVGNQSAIEIALKRQPGANTVAVTRAVNGILDEIRAGLPGDAELRVLYDRGDYINASISDVELTLLITLVLVIAVVMLFLRNLSATLIVATVLPASLLGTFGAMQLLGYSLDNVSMLALTLSVGILVDDAIVVLENIVRHLEMGKTRKQAALDGTAEIGFTVLSITLSLAAVFLPVIFLGGLVGRLFAEFGVTMAIAVLLSGALSLSLTPMLASRFLVAKPSQFFLFRWFEAGFGKVEQGYRASLAWCMGRRALMLMVALGVLAGTGGLYQIVNKGFIPRVDSGKIDGNTRVPEGTPYREFVAAHNKVVAIVRANPNVAEVLSVIGADSSASSTGRLLIGLKPLGQRPDSADDVITQVRAQTQKIQGIEFVMRNPPAIDIGPQASNTAVQYLLQSTDTAALYKASDSFMAILAKQPGLKDVNTGLQLRNPEIRVDILRAEAAARGVSPAKIQDTLQTAFGGRKISSIYASTDQYQVIVEVDKQYQADINALNAIFLSGNSGEMVPLTAVASIHNGVGPVSIAHYGSLPSVTLSFNLAPGAALGEATSSVQALAARNLNPKVAGRFVGAAQAFQDSLRDLPVLLLMTVVLIYMILAVLYEHFMHPVTILTALPLAGFGALLMLWLFGQELNLFSFVGLILLVGLVKKNGIMMVDFALHLLNGGDGRFKQPRAAMLEASLVRFRPIMMTSMAAILGTLPIALGLGAGAESRRPLGIAIVGGLLFSQLLTLYITPVFFVSMGRFVAWLARRKPPIEAAPIPG